MGVLINGDDGLPAEEVGTWAIEKHKLLCEYVDMSRGVRARWIKPDGAGATLIDVFCGPGRCKVRKTGQWIDGSCVAAWKKSIAGGSPFSQVYIADLDSERRSAAAKRLRKLGAPVIELPGDAVAAAKKIVKQANPYGLHFAFLDPYNLGTLDFDVIKAFAVLKRIDMLVHVSKMDLQRNLGFNLKRQQSAFDLFAPGWRNAVRMDQSSKRIRVEIFEYWRRLVAALGLEHSPEMKLITGEKKQHLYWLLLVAKHDLATKFWSRIAIPKDQGRLF